MSKCLVVKREVLEKTHFWQKIPRVDGKIFGMIKLSEDEIKEFLKIIDENKEFRERKGIDGIEDKPEWQQIIFYSLIRQSDKFFVYQRGGKDSKSGEERLELKISAGIGGHIEPFDNSLIDSLYRELDEEVVFEKNSQEINLKNSQEGINKNLFSKIANIKILGLIKYETDEVGQVHLGLACKVDLLDHEIEVKVREEEENIKGKMMTEKEYQNLIKVGSVEVETWTKILMEKFK